MGAGGAAAGEGSLVQKVTAAASRTSGEPTMRGALPKRTRRRILARSELLLRSSAARHLADHIHAAILCGRADGGADAAHHQLILVRAEPGGEEGGDVVAGNREAIMPAQHGHAAQRFEPLVGKLGAAAAAHQPAEEAADAAGGHAASKGCPTRASRITDHSSAREFGLVRVVCRHARPGRSARHVCGSMRAR